LENGNEDGGNRIRHAFGLALKLGQELAKH
jgi:hypothetical protein